jgi:hypothetical protein
MHHQVKRIAPARLLVPTWSHVEYPPGIRQRCLNGRQIRCQSHGLGFVEGEVTVFDDRHPPERIA